jgi:hypothetical protein
MRKGMPIDELLRWRLEQAEAEAPPSPSAARLLDLARPWWETLPERFAELVERLGKIQVAFGHAMADPRSPRGGGLMPALVLRSESELETSVRPLYLDVHDDHLRLRFQLDAALEPPEQVFEVTFVPERGPGPPFSARAVLSLDREYSLETPLPVEVARSWEALKVTHRIPYRLILRSCETGG